MVGTWIKLATATASGSSKTLSSGSFTTKKYLRVEAYGDVASGNMDNIGWRFNEDVNSNYTYDSSIDYDSGNNGSGTYIRLGGGSATGGSLFVSTVIANKSSNVKICTSECCKSTGTGSSSNGNNVASTNLHSFQTKGKWNNSSDNITSIQLKHEGTANWSTNSTITVWGASYDVVSDEKTTLTNVPINTRYEEVDTRKIYRWADSTDKTNIYNYWKMDSSTNTDTATTSNGYTNGLGKNGTNSNITVSTSDKKIGTASYEFNGSSSKCTYGSTSDWKFLHNGDAWSATFWMKLDSLAGGEILGTMAGNSGSETGMHFYVHPDSNGMWTMQVFGGSSGNYPLNSNVSNVLTTGTWNHYACTFDGSTTYTVYKDGVSKGTMTKGSASFSSSNSTYTLHMGDSGGNSDELDGKLDDFALWKTELSASFIKELYEASATDNITGWKERGS